MSIFLFYIGIIFFLCFPTSVGAQAPAEYADLYSELDTRLAVFEAKIDSQWDKTSYPVTYAAELSNANAHRGYALLEPTTMDGLRLTLTRLQQLGITGVKVGINYPILMPGIDTEGKFVDFYRQVATEVKSRNMKLFVSMGHMIPGFAKITSQGYADTFEEYKEGRRTQAHLIASQIRPDYLTILMEPTTEAFSTNLPQLEQPEKQLEIAQRILTGLERGTAKRGSILVGGGSGTWEQKIFIEQLAALSELDYIDLHVYPVNKIEGVVVVDLLQNMLSYADIGLSNNKKVIIGEAWLYKSRSSELSLGAFHKETFARDPFSFWQLLDQDFLRLLAKTANYKKFELISPFWVQYLFAYIDYDSRTQALSADERIAESTQKASQNIVSNIFSSTGVYYRGIIANIPTPTIHCNNPLDLNCDGTVNIIDLSTLLANFGTLGSTRMQGDVDGNGAVNIADLSRLLAGFGR